MDEYQKKFKRLLKELGIYSAWVSDRLNSHENNTNYRKDIFFRLPQKFLKYPKNAIDLSFTWSETEHNELWLRLYNILSADLPIEKAYIPEFRCSYYKIEDILNEECIADIKNKLKKSVKNYG